MSVTAARLWSSVLQLLQDLPYRALAEREAIYDSIRDMNNKMKRLEALPLPARARLIRRIKAPHQLGAVCCMLQAGSSSSSKTVYLSDLAYALHLLVGFLIAAQKGLSPLAVAAGDAQDLLHSISSQLQECGFLAKLPDLMLTTAKQLQDRAAAAKQAAVAAAAAVHEASADVSGPAGSNSISPNSSSAGSVTGLPVKPAADPALATICNSLLLCCLLLEQLCARQSGLPLATVASQDAAILLSLAVLQQESVRLADLPQDVAPHDPGNQRLWPSSQQAVRMLYRQLVDKPIAAGRLTHPDVQSALMLIVLQGSLRPTCQPVPPPAAAAAVAAAAALVGRQQLSSMHSMSGLPPGSCSKSMRQSMRPTWSLQASP